MLLSFDDYQNKFGGIQVTDENEFKKLESSTESLFNALTNMFYVKHDIDADPNEYRVKLFRKAMTLQIDFAKSTGIVADYDIAQQSIKSVSIDGTTVTADKTLSDLTRNGLYNLAGEDLYQTGLLFRGAWIC